MSAATDSIAFYDQFEPALTGTGDQTELAAQVLSDPACGGPWSPQLQHGGPPTALLVLAAERLAASAAGRSDLIAVRLAAEFIGPVPVADLMVTARVRRLSRSAVLVSAQLGTSDRVSLQARVWLLAPGQLASSTGAPEAAQSKQPAQSVQPEQLASFDIYGFPYANQLDWRVVSGSAYQPGPAAAWIRPRIPLVEGQPLSPLQRAALLGDSASGISAELDWQAWSFANVDLDLHLVRPSVGEWLLLDAQTWLGDGMATTRSTLADQAGPVGFGLQTLLVRPSSS
ncbi:MAG: thioesterase family protein [Jatrophihabitantaceae bacterium]